MAALALLVGCAGQHVPSAPATPAPAPKDPCVVGPRVLSSAKVPSGRPTLASRREELAVVWVEADEDHPELRLQVFDAHGEPLTGTQRIAGLRGGGGEPVLAATDDGYAVAWSIERGETTAIEIQRLDARGRSVGPAVEAFTSPTARPLALTATPDGFVVVWWQWAQQPHLEVATWLDRSGKRVADVELTRLPCEDPVADVQALPDGRLVVAWEQSIDGDARTIVGVLSKTGVLRQGSEYVGRDPSLVREGVAMSSPDGANVLYASFGASAAMTLAPGRMVDAAILGADSVLCRAQHGEDERGGTLDELYCARERGARLSRERRLARSPRLLGSGRLADTSFGYAVALESVQPGDDDVGAVLLSVVQCND